MSQLDIGTLVGYLDLDVKAFDRKLARTEETARRSGRKGGKGFGDEFSDETDRSMTGRFADVAKKVMGSFGGFLASSAKPAAIAAATSFAATFLAQAAAGLASGAVKLARGFGSALALAPAGLLAAGAALGAVKVALSGVGDALKAGLANDTEKFQEALKGLSPAAREVLRGVAGLRGELDGLRTAVQESFFKPFADSVRPLGETYLPMIERTLGGISGGFGQVVDQMGNFLLLPSTSKLVSAALGDVEQAVTNVAAGGSALFQAFLPLVTVGASFLPGLAGGFTDLAVRAAAFMQEAERTGRLREFIQGGIDAVRDLVDTGHILVSIFRNIGSIGRTVFDAVGLETGNILGTVDQLTGSFARWLKTADGARAIEAAIDGIKVVLLATKGPAALAVRPLLDMAVNLAPKIADLIGALSELASAVAKVGLEALAPVIGAIGVALGVVLPLLTSLAGWLADNEPVIQGIGIAVLTLLVPAFLAWAINAGLAAASTLLLIAPLIAVGAAIAGLAALVIVHFDTIKRWISNVWNWVRDNWPLLLGILTGPFGLAAMFIADHWNQVVGFVRGLKDRITSAASGMWDGITAAFKAAINTIIDWWNRLSFPSLTVGGQDPLGPFGPSIPRTTIGGWELPTIPRLHKGIRQVPGGSNNEMLALLQGGEQVLARNDPLNVRNLSNSASSPHRPVVVHIHGEGDSSGLMEHIRWYVLNDGGGDVQVALGQ